MLVRPVSRRAHAGCLAAAQGEVDVREELFGDSDEEEHAPAPAPAPAARKKTGRLRQTGAPPAVAKETAEDRRKALQQLALSKKREAVRVERLFD